MGCKQTWRSSDESEENTSTVGSNKYRSKHFIVQRNPIRKAETLVEVFRIETSQV